MLDTKDMDVYIVRYLHNEITEHELRELTHWLQETPANRQAFFQLKSVHDVLRNQQLLSDSEAEQRWRKLFRKIPLKPNADISRRRIFLKNVLPYVAVSLVAAFIGLGIGKRVYMRTMEKSSHMNFSEVSVQKGGKPNTVRLSDGSVVRLLSATTLRYAANYSNGNMREVFLDGEAYFDVAKDAAKPFIVRLKRQNIIVHGTSFGVEAYHDESYYAVTLLEGSVSLESMDTNGIKISDISLKPGQKAYFDHLTEKVSVEQVGTLQTNTWKQEEYKFKDEPLGLIVKRLEKYYDVNIHLHDKQLENIRYTGTFSLRQNIQDVLRIINNDGRFRFRQTKNDIYIENKK